VTPENRQTIINTFCNILTDATDSAIRSSAAQSLGRLGAESATELLCQIAIQDQDTSVRLAAINALVAIAQPQGLNPMSDSSKNQPIFHINQVGQINTGDVTIKGDQVGIQHNYAPNPTITEASKQLAELLSKLRTQYPDKTDPEIFEILLNGFANMSQNSPQTWERWQDVFSIIFAGGVEATKVLVPVAGIPIEVGRKLYDIYDRNRKQLPGA
jgi:HEAT repeats